MSPSPRLVLLACLAVLLGGCAARALRPRGLAPAPTTAEALDAALEPRRVAIVVGIDTYDDPAFPPLRFAAADANAVADRLSVSGFDTLVRLTGPELTSRSVLIARLKEVTRSLRAEDTLVLYVSGHGSRVPDGERWRRFLLTRDSAAGGLEATALDLHALEDWFGRQAPVRKALILDACFSGDGKSVVRPGAPAETDEVLVTRTSPRSLDAGEVHLHATSPGRAALEDDRLGHGVYTHHLLEALSWASREADLDGDGVVTAWEAHHHARSRTLDHTRGAQVPEIVLRSVGEADVVLSGDVSRRRRDRALVYLLDTRVASAEPVEDGPRLVIDGRPKGHLPGAIPVEPGAHDIALVGADGAVQVEGRTWLARGRSYSTDALRHRIEGTAREVRLAATTSSTGLMDRVGGRVDLGVDAAFVLHRREGPGRGLGLGTGLALTGIADGEGGRRRSHLRVWGQQRVRWRGLVGWAGLGVAADLVPARADASRPEGWYLFTGFGELGLGAELRPELTPFLTVRPQLGSFDRDLDGSAEPTAVTAVTAGLAVGF